MYTPFAPDSFKGVKFEMNFNSGVIIVETTKAALSTWPRDPHDHIYNQQITDYEMACESMVMKLRGVTLRYTWMIANFHPE